MRGEILETSQSATSKILLCLWSEVNLEIDGRRTYPIEEPQRQKQHQVVSKLRDLCPLVLSVGVRRRHY